jgi:hypothetical protein
VFAVNFSAENEKVFFFGDEERGYQISSYECGDETVTRLDRTEV